MLSTHPVKKLGILSNLPTNLLCQTQNLLFSWAGLDAVDSDDGRGFSIIQRKNTHRNHTSPADRMDIAFSVSSFSLPVCHLHAGLCLSLVAGTFTRAITHQPSAFPPLAATERRRLASVNSVEGTNSASHKKRNSQSDAMARASARRPGSRLIFFCCLSIAEIWYPSSSYLVSLSPSLHRNKSQDTRLGMATHGYGSEIRPNTKRNAH